MKIDLEGLEHIARAADKETPRNLWEHVASDGALIGSASERHVEGNSPATTLSLIRRIRELEAALGQAISDWSSTDRYGEWSGEIDGVRDVLDRGTIRYGRAPHTNDEWWEIDQPAEEDK